MTDQIESGANIVICQKWEESEAGWGVRPDGFSLHLTDRHLRDYVAAHWAGMPDSPPAEYDRPSGEPYPTGVSEAVISELEGHNGSRRYFAGVQLPGSGSLDGWISQR